MKKRIRLTESNLHRIVNRSVKRVLNEISTDTLHKAIIDELTRMINKGNYIELDPNN